MKKKFIIDIVIIIILFLGINKGNTIILEKFLTPSTEYQINYSFDKIKSEKYEAIILGNSRVYRGINPDKLTCATFYNFAHDNDSFNQMYYKLLYANTNMKLKYLIMGIDYFQFSFLSDSRNCVYSRKFPDEYLKDFNSKYDLKNESKNKKFIFKNYFERKSQQFFIFIKRLPDFILGKKMKYILEKNGWFHEVTNKKAEKNEILKREYNILEIQDRYFYKILEYCSKNNIEIFMVMPPLRKVELNNYPVRVIEEYEEKFKNVTTDKVHYLNYKNYFNSDINYFEDVTHLNTNGANNFSEILNKDLVKLLKNREKIYYPIFN